MRLRAATAQDADVIARLHADGDLLTIYRDALLPDAWARLQSEKRVLWEGLSAEPPIGQQAWVVEDQHVVGFTSAGPDPDSPEQGKVFALFVERDAWGEGLGSRLLAAAEGHLQDQYLSAGLWVVEHNVRARRLYEQRGWYDAGSVKQQHGVRFIRYGKRLSTQPHDLGGVGA